MIEQFMDERRIIKGITLRGGAMLTILVLAPGSVVPNDGCILSLLADELEPGDHGLWTLCYVDALAVAHSKPSGAVTIVGMTEEDLRTYGFPMSDGDLAKVIEGVGAQGPVSIGLDLYRDLPEPRTGEQYPKLEAAFKQVNTL